MATLSELGTGLSVCRLDYNFVLMAHFGSLLLRLVVVTKLEFRIAFGPLGRNEFYLLQFPPYRNSVMRRAG